MNWKEKIIERLTKEADEYAVKLVNQGAEIERLQYAVKQWQQNWGNANAEIKRLKKELEKANNEFGCMTANWPELWQRIADLKKLSNDRWQEIERMRERESMCHERALEQEIERLLTAIMRYRSTLAGTALLNFEKHFAREATDET